MLVFLRFADHQLTDQDSGTRRKIRMTFQNCVDRFLTHLHAPVLHQPHPGTPESAGALVGAAKLHDL